MKRFTGILAYDGSAYFGFQRQPDPTPTIQAALESAISRVTRQAVNVLAAGRTDAGVHAMGQVIAFDVEWRHPASELFRAINAMLPQDIALQELWRQPGFHPRYDALWRQYAYRIATPSVRNPLLHGRVWQLVGQSLDFDTLNAAAAMCLGRQDFAAFGRPPQAGSDNTVREIYDSRWEMEKSLWGDMLTYRVRATAFLYHMVRRMVGMMAQAGSGKIDLREFKRIILSRNIEEAKALAPPQGLMLEAVGYRPRPVAPSIASEPVMAAVSLELE